MVSDSYIKNCTDLWITAAIQRAVDDKTAKNLLRNSFEQQLKHLDGLAGVTFICTKTDDVSETEISASLGLNEEMTEFWKQEDDLQRKLTRLQSEIKELVEAKSEISRTIEDLDDKIDTMEDLVADLTEEELVMCKARQKELKKSKKECDIKMTSLKVQERALIAEGKALTCKLRSTCIKARNEYARTTITNNFSMDMKELVIFPFPCCRFASVL